MTELSQVFKDIINPGQLDGSEILHVDKIDSLEVLRKYFRFLRTYT